MPKGLALPRGQVLTTYEGDTRRRAYPFDINVLASREPDPRQWEPRWEISEFKRMSEVDPEKIMAEMSLHDIIRLWASRKRISDSRGKHPLFEIFLHMIFPKKKEKALVYIAAWRIRDRLSYEEIARRLGNQGAVKASPHSVRKYCDYISRCIHGFVHKFKLRDKFKAEIREAEALEEEIQFQEDVREIVNG